MKKHLPYSSLSAKEKKDFLSNEMVERMIRIEQRVCVRFKKPVKYNKTEYYKSLTPSQKKSFLKYLRMKKIRQIVVGVIFLSPLFLLVLINSKLTGNIVLTTNTEKLGASAVLVLLLGIFFIFAILSFREKMWKKNRFAEHEKILENVLYKIKKREK